MSMLRKLSTEARAAPPLSWKTCFCLFHYHIFYLNMLYVHYMYIMPVPEHTHTYIYVHVSTNMRYLLGEDRPEVGGDRVEGAGRDDQQLFWYAVVLLGCWVYM